MLFRQAWPYVLSRYALAEIDKSNAKDIGNDRSSLHWVLCRMRTEATKDEGGGDD